MVVLAARQLVQSRRVRGQQARHLVDERAGAARAGAVHPLLQAAGEIGDLGVLPAQLDGHVGVREEPLHGAGAGEHLLHERKLQPPGDGQPAGAGDRDPSRSDRRCPAPRASQRASITATSVPRMSARCRS